MNLNPEQQKELALFPPPLRELVQAELAAGNTIVEIGHSWPAPPAGAYVKLGRKVSTRPRGSTGGLDFYDRNSSIYSGEFTDAKRFYFVIEPPNPPPPEPDMDAIRNAAAGKNKKDEELARLAQREPGASGLVAGLKQLGRELMGAKKKRAAPRTKSRSGPQLPPHSILQSSTLTGASWLLHFQDRRPPQEIQFQLERDLMSLMPPQMESGKLVCRGTPKVNGAVYSFLLTFEAALPRANCYSLRVEVSWADAAATYHDYYRKTSSSWFDFWTRDFQRASPPEAGEGSAERYRQLSEGALKAEAGLTSVEAVQQAITGAMKQGASFRTAHKEGGTSISWQKDRFVRSDYGESDERKEFTSETEFLKFLHQFFGWETSRSVYPNKVSELETWKLILRLLRTR